MHFLDHSFVCFHFFRVSADSQIFIVAFDLVRSDDDLLVIGKLFFAFMNILNLFLPDLCTPLCSFQLIDALINHPLVVVLLNLFESLRFDLISGQQ